jgi:CPA2 family monovalent cation:H+ antiporter-2
MNLPLLNDIVIIFGLSVGVVFICHRIQVPAIVGFLLTGVLAGPHGLGLVEAVDEVEILAEVGVVLLLFTIGIEFSLKTLLQIKKSVLLGGSLQLILTLLVAYFIAHQTRFQVGESIFIGLLIALSSTAIVLKLLQERGEIDSPHGRTSLAILIFQDVAVVPMMLFTPLLAGATGNFAETLLILAVKGIGIILLAIVLAKWVVPQVLYQIVRTRSRELFLLSMFVICLAVMWFTSWIGLSFALGAFLAGLIVSESRYSHQALGYILPFRDVFISFFFVSIGMLLDVGFLFQRPVLIVSVTLGVLVLKAVIGGLVTLSLGFPLRTAILVGLGLSQVGEFSFILSKTGVEYGLLAGDLYQLFLALSVLSMAATPFIIALAPRIEGVVLRWPLLRKLKAGLYPMQAGDHADMKDHLIIIGFGVNGRNVSRAAKAAGIPYIITEMNPETVRNEQEKGEPIHYVDATQEVALDHVGMKEARVLVVAITDPGATRKITEMARRMNPRTYIIVRTPYVQETRALFELGADEVIPQEFEASVEIFARVLVKYLIPKDEIEKFIAEVRSDGYQMFRSLSEESVALSNLKLHLPDIDINMLRLRNGSSLVGKSLAEIQLRKAYSVTLLAIRRGTEILSNPGGDIRLSADDVLVILGQPDKITQLRGLFEAS